MHKILFRRLRPDAIMPVYQTDGAAGFDLAVPSATVILPHAIAKVPLGFALRVPDGYMVLLALRSSAPLRYGLSLANGVGIVDSDYCGNEDEYALLLRSHNENTIVLPAGTRIAQGILLPALTRVDAYFWEVDDLGDASRGGFGSTGMH